MAAQPKTMADAASTSVSENLGSLLDEGGSYLTQARQQGKRAAAGRGLSGSSIASQASQGAAIQAALPIASQDAATEAARLQAEADRAHQRRMQSSQFQHDRWSQSESQRHSAEQADFDRKQQQMLQEAGLDQEKWKLGATVSSNIQGQYSTALQDILNQYSVSVNQIETATDIKTEDKNSMINNSIKRRDADLNFLKNLYTNMPGFSTDWGLFPSA